jgi:dipeptidyl aminopeptidase/acylaminoacyl peptidase
MQRITTILFLLLATSLPTATAAPRRPFVPADLAHMYEQARGLASSVEGTVFRDRVKPQWLQDGKRFWYRNELADGAREYVLVDAGRGSRQLAFDQLKLAAGLAEAAGKDVDPGTLDLKNLWFSESAEQMRCDALGRRWQVDLASYKCQPSEQADPVKHSSPTQREDLRRTHNGGRSPDDQWEVLTRDHNLVLKNKESGEEQPLTTDGNEGDAYGAPSWSPDSQTLVAYRTEPGTVSQVHLLESSPREGFKAKLHSRLYAQPGDKFPSHQMWLFEIPSGKALQVKLERIDFHGIPTLRWDRDSEHFCFRRDERGHQRVRVVSVDRATGETQNVVDEKSATFIDGTQHFYHQTADDQHIIWASERSGWRQLYLYDRAEGVVVNPITQGEWRVRGVQRVDEDKQHIWFSASGMNKGQDPYLIHFYRINFDGSGLLALTAGNGTHQLDYSPGHDYYLDRWSRVDLPPVTELRKTSDGSLICLLETADITNLLVTGWQPPEVFHTTGRDGSSEIWGIICRPRQFDSRRRYPVIEHIYAGPHSSHVPKSFNPHHRRMQALAELGFIVVMIDGMGTSNRSKAFHDVCWQNLADAGFPDRILWHQAVARKYSYYDSQRLGIYGTSAGGQSSTGALLFHSDFYDVAVSSCGCHDNRVDKQWWNEQWMGYPVKEHYGAQSNVTNAHRLQGQLLLIVGEMDTNVPPESTLQVADALIKAHRDFDMLLIPGLGHSSGGDYGQHRRWDYFVEHLHGVKPPAWPRSAEKLD